MSAAARARPAARTASRTTYSSRSRTGSSIVDCRAIRIVGRCNADSDGSPVAGETVTLPGLANCHCHAFHRALRGTHAAGARVVLDLARADVRRRGRAHAGHLLRAGPRHLRRDARDRDHARSGSSTTCTTSPTGRRTTTPTRWARRCSPRPTRPGSGSGCSTPATSPPGSGARRRVCRCATPTATRTRWAERVAAFDDPRVGAAIHSVRAVPRDQLKVVVEAAAGHAAARAPLRAGRRERRLPRRPPA